MIKCTIRIFIRTIGMGHRGKMDNHFGIELTQNKRQRMVIARVFHMQRNSRFLQKI